MFTPTGFYAGIGRLEVAVRANQHLLDMAEYRAGKITLAEVHERWKLRAEAKAGQTPRDLEPERA
jgi:hypothetical protein